MKYIVSEEQFYTLAALAGISELYFFGDVDEMGKAPTEENVIRALTELYSGGWLTQTDGRFALTEKSERISRIIKETPCVVDLEFPAGNYPRQLIYTAKKDEIVTVERCYEGGRLCVRLQKTEGPVYVGDLFRNEVFPGGILEERSEAGMLEEQMPELLEDSGMEASKPAELLIRRIMTGSGETDNRIEITGGGIFRQLHLYGMYDSYDHIYSKEELGELLMKELRGEKL